MKIHFNTLSRVPENTIGREEIEQLNSMCVFSCIKEFTHGNTKFYFGIIASGQPVLFISCNTRVCNCSETDNCNHVNTQKCAIETFGETDANSDLERPFKEFFLEYHEEANTLVSDMAIFSENKLFVKYDNKSYVLDNSELTGELFYKSIPVYPIDVKPENFLNKASDSFTDLKDIEVNIRCDEYDENIKLAEQLVESVKHKKFQFIEMMKTLGESKNSFSEFSSTREGLLKEQLMLYPINRNIEKLINSSFVENMYIKTTIENMIG